MVYLPLSSRFREQEVAAFLPTPEQLKVWLEDFSRRTGCKWRPGVDYKVRNAPAVRCPHLSVPVGRIPRVAAGRLSDPGLSIQSHDGISHKEGFRTLEELHNAAVKALRRRARRLRSPLGP